MSRDDWNAIAGAIRSVRGRQGMHEPTLDAVTDEIAKVLKERSTRFDSRRFRMLTKGAK